MHRAPLTSRTLDAYQDRLNRLTPQHAPRWGGMNTAAMTAHLRRAVEMSLDEQAIPDVSNVFSRHVIKVFALFTPMPWPQGGVKVPPELTPEPQGDFEAERDQLLQTLRRFLQTAEAEPKRTYRHPLFGNLKLRTWQRLHGRHLHHHLSQFGA